jgi:Domain of unknown function (DUF1707)
MRIEPPLRASDADREQVAERLRHATAEGRLNADELEGRLQTLFAARTYGELDALLADLPAGRSPSKRRIRVARPAAAVGAFTLMLAALGALTIARLHSAAAVAVGGPGGGKQLELPGPPVKQLRLLPPLADPNHGPIVAASMVGAFAVLLVCGAVVWVLMHSREAPED